MIKNFIISCMVCIGALSGLLAQYSIQLQKPNIIGLKTTDLWNCIVQNNSNFALEVYLQGTITEKRKGKVYEVKSGNFQLKPPITIYNSANYADLKGESVISSDKLFVDHIIRTNTLPNGEYTFCAFIFNSKSNAKLAEDCIQFSINEVTPPFLISPMNKDIVCEELPAFIWGRQRGSLIGSDLTYQIKIVEVLSGQNPVAAMKSNPCYYCESNLKEPLHQFSFKGLPLQHEKRYAWSISVVDIKREIARSDIWEFTWKKCIGTNDNFPKDPEVEEEEEEVTNPPIAAVGYFYPTMTQASELIAVSDTTLNFRIINHEIKQNMDAIILDGQQKPILTKALVLQTGHNFYSFSMKSLKLQSMTPYTLKLVTNTGTWYYLSFFTLN